VDLGPYLRAHSYLRIERPFTLWHAEVDDVALVRLTGELLAAALARGTELADIVLRANNVTITGDDSPSRAGDYVALTIEGAGDWSPEVSWTPASEGDVVLVNDDVTAAARAAAIVWGYTRAFDGEGSVTVMVPRAESDRPDLVG
jgi:hypothetical protein